MDYEKAYKDALSRAKDFMNDKVHYALRKGESIMCWIFPELRENEDEKIRKAIYNCVFWFGFDSCFFKDVSQEECLAWLEKQGEFANFRNKIQIGDNVTRNQAGALVNLSQLERVAKPREKQCEQEPAWSKECNAKIKRLKDYIVKHKGFTEETMKMLDIINSIKPQPHWKPTKEQIYALSMAYKDSLAGGENLPTQTETLKSLYNDLKKL